MKRTGLLTMAICFVVLLTGCGADYKPKDVVLVQPDNAAPFSGSILWVGKHNGIYYYTIQPCNGGQPAEWPQSQVIRSITDINQEWKAIAAWNSAHTLKSPEEIEREQRHATSRSQIFWYSFIPVLLIVLSWLHPQCGGTFLVGYYIVCCIINPWVAVPLLFLTIVISVLYIVFVAFLCGPVFAFLSYLCWWIMFLLVG